MIPKQRKGKSFLLSNLILGAGGAHSLGAGATASN